MSSSHSEASRLLCEALALPSVQREEFLEERCATDELYREVRSLLDHYDESFLTNRTPVLEALAEAPDAPAETLPVPGAYSAECERLFRGS